MSAASAVLIFASARPYQRWKSGSCVRGVIGGSGVGLGAFALGGPALQAALAAR